MNKRKSLLTFLVVVIILATTSFSSYATEQSIISAEEPANSILKDNMDSMESSEQVMKLTSAPNGISGNGTGGIYIDINAAPYTTFAQIPTWGKYAYTNQGCAWFASARVKQLTGKGSMIYSGSSWWNSQGTALGFTKGSTIRAKALACYTGHVAVVEKVEGSTVILSEGGYNWSALASNGYTIIRQTTIQDVENNQYNTFLGYVYLDGYTETPQNSNIFANVYADSITETEAVLWAELNDYYYPSQIGVYVGVSPDNMTKIPENINGIKVKKMWYSMNKWYGTLQKQTTYYYQMYAIINGIEYKTTIHQFITPGDRTAPQISNARIISTTGESYTVMCTATDDQSLAKVIFPTWTEANGQDDLPASLATNPAVVGQANGSEYTFTVYASSHNHESGRYITDIYGIDAAGNWSAPLQISCELYPLLGIELAPSFKTLQCAENCQLTVNYNPSNTTEPNKAVTWSSLNPQIATVDSNGLVIAKAVGQTSIIATVGDKTAHCTVKVEAVLKPEPGTDGNSSTNNEDNMNPQIPDTIPNDGWPFTDVGEASGNWKYESVKYVYDNGIMNGIAGTNLFQPDAPLTRAMFATVLYRIAGMPSITYTNQFNDVEAGKWYSDAIIWAYKEGIVNGLLDGSYGINNNITREQIAKMLYEYAAISNLDVRGQSDLTIFTDYQTVSNWAQGYMGWSVNSGMITGKPNPDLTTFRLDPKGQATRAECAKMLKMFMEKYNNDLKSL